eukprot:TRINITY_DN93865_c0_g1_i1.p1 TRINITY_DN93865_c0_g1~~TRINITY_DN93865_c0_g1_i1.p1  ORF type:complete len:225 (-),score=11.09 TRINITY_DN93865_c0_g1_i1:560-1165(-)
MAQRPPCLTLWVACCLALASGYRQGDESADLLVATSAEHVLETGHAEHRPRVSRIAGAPKAVASAKQVRTSTHASRAGTTRTAVTSSEPDTYDDDDYEYEEEEYDEEALVDYNVHLASPVLDRSTRWHGGMVADERTGDYLADADPDHWIDDDLYVHYKNADESIYPGYFQDGELHSVGHRRRYDKPRKSSPKEYTVEVPQ